MVGAEREKQHHRHEMSGEEEEGSRRRHADVLGKNGSIEEVARADWVTVVVAQLVHDDHLKKAGHEVTAGSMEQTKVELTAWKARARPSITEPSPMR